MGAFLFGVSGDIDLLSSGVSIPEAGQTSTISDRATYGAKKKPTSEVGSFWQGLTAC